MNTWFQYGQHVHAFRFVDGDEVLEPGIFRGIVVAAPSGDYRNSVFRIEREDGTVDNVPGRFIRAA